MLRDPLVTTIITTHRRSDLLRNALASVRAERYRHLDIVVVEDGFELNADDIAGERPARLIQLSAGGCAPARNAGLAAALGSYVICLDDDDVALPNRITDLVEAAESGSHAIAYGRTIKQSPDHDSILIPSWPAEDRALVGFTGMLVHMPHVNSVLVAAEPLRRVGGFDLRTPNFDELSAWLQLLAGGASAVFRDVTVAEWRTHGEGLSGAIARDRSMKTSLMALLERAVAISRGSDLSTAAAILEKVRSSTVETFDQYVELAAPEVGRRRGW